MGRLYLNGQIASLYPAFLLGLSSTLIQILILRRLIPVFSGNELIISLILGAWLVLTGTGSMVGKKIRGEQPIGISFLLFGLLLIPLWKVVWGVFTVFGYTPGELPSFPVTALWITLMLLLPCLISGCLYTFCLRMLGGKGAITYGVESGGAFIGGVLFTLFLSGRLDDEALLMVVSSLCILSGVFYWQKRYLLFLVLLPLTFQMKIPDIKDHVLPGRLKTEGSSRYGVVEVRSIKDEKVFYLSGRVLFTYPLKEVSEKMAHIPYFIHPEPGRALVIGGSPETAVELSMHPGMEVEYIEINKHLLEMIRTEIPLPAKLKVINDDAIHYLKESSPEPYDLIIINSPPPTTGFMNRYFTREFFLLLKKHLKGDGILEVKAEPASGYMNPSTTKANGVIYNTLRKVFSHLGVSSMEDALVFASDAPIDLSPEALSKRLVSSGLAYRYLTASIIEDIFSPLKTWHFESLLKDEKGENTIHRPLAYLYHILVWSEREGGVGISAVVNHRWVFLFVLVISSVLLIIFLSRASVNNPVMFTTGTVTISTVVLGILLFQSLKGEVYEYIGLLTGLYMGGSSAGSLIAEKLPSGFKAVITEMLWVFILGLFLAVGEQTILLYIILFLAGLIGGVQYGILSEGTDPAVLYFTDLLGATFGTLFVSVFLFPLFGLAEVVGFLLFLKLAGVTVSLLKSGTKELV